MKELKELRLTGDQLILNDNLVRGAILPERASQLARNVVFTGDTVVEGAVYGNRIEVRGGEIKVRGAVFARKELYISPDAGSAVTFEKCVASAESVVTRGAANRVTFMSDVNAKSVALTNAFVAGSIYADEITLENCVVIGGVFATADLDLRHTLVGTFNSPSVSISGINYILLPSAFSIEPLRAAPHASLFNLSLADLGALYRGVEQSDKSGKIEVDITNDTLTSTLTDETTQKTLRSYTVVGKVLAADLMDTDRFQNHFLLTAAALGPQMLRTYEIGTDASGRPVPLDGDRLRRFFFNLLDGRIEVRTIDGTFRIVPTDPAR